MGNVFHEDFQDFIIALNKAEEIPLQVIYINDLENL